MSKINKNSLCISILLLVSIIFGITYFHLNNTNPPNIDNHYYLCQIIDESYDTHQDDIFYTIQCEQHNRVMSTHKTEHDSFEYEEILLSYNNTQYEIRYMCWGYNLSDAYEVCADTFKPFKMIIVNESQ